MEEALGMSDALRKELPRMLQEHTKIRAATEKLRVVAQKGEAFRIRAVRRGPRRSTRGRRSKCYTLRPFSWVTSSERG